jgi:hypothetical protein
MYSFETSTLDEIEWSTSESGEGSSLQVEGSVYPRGGVDVLKNRKLLPIQRFEHWIFQPVYHTENDISAHVELHRRTTKLKQKITSDI